MPFLATIASFDLDLAPKLVLKKPVPGYYGMAYSALAFTRVTFWIGFFALGSGNPNKRFS